MYEFSVIIILCINIVYIFHFLFICGVVKVTVKLYSAKKDSAIVKSGEGQRNRKNFSMVYTLIRKI